MKYSIEELANLYSQGRIYPNRDQWQRLLEGDLDQPLTVVNFFKLRELENYFKDLPSGDRGNR